MEDKLARINLISRAGLAFIFFYHGLIPKILFFSETERELGELHGLGEYSQMISQLFGVFEMGLAVLILVMRRSLVPVYVVGVLLIGLLVDVVIVKPELLIEAFNPVTINGVGLVLCWLVYLSDIRSG